MEIHIPAILSDTDPAVTYGVGGDDGVFPGLWWLEHQASQPDTLLRINVRNAANDGWETVPPSDHTHSGDDVLVTEKDESGSNYTLVLADAGKLVTLSHGSATTLTVPLNASEAFPVGTQILFRQGDAGKVTVTPVSGVTLEAESSKLTTTGQHAVGGLIKVGTDTWSVFGNLEP
ncbi:MAG: hypothetical protein ACLFWG_00315 [Longimicrobiales bacterium]